MAIVTTKYYLFPFAEAGDVEAVPDPAQLAGTVSYENGYPFRYSLAYPTDPDALSVPREAINQLFLDATTNIQEYQQWGVPNFITTDDNGGSAFSYSKHAFALYDDGTHGPRVFQSLINSNTSLPTVTANWLWVDNCSLKTVVNNADFAMGVADGSIVYLNSSGIFNLAIANGAAAQQAMGIADVTFKRVYAFGECPLLTGLVVGSTYYLSASIAGEITLTPTPVEVGIALATDTLLIDIQSQSNTVVMRAYSTINQTLPISPAASAPIQFNMVSFDTNGIMNTSNYRATPNVAGTYRITATVIMNTSASSVNDNISASITVNGTVIKSFIETFSTGGTGGIFTFPLEDLHYFNGSTDYAAVQARNETVGGDTFITQGTATQVTLSMELVAG